jgi:hypothetical protein
MKVSGQLHAPAVSLPQKGYPVPIVGGHQGPSGRCGEEENLFPLPGIFQFVARHYSDWANPAPSYVLSS